jgi:hypothetical protein
MMQFVTKAALLCDIYQNWVQFRHGGIEEFMRNTRSGILKAEILG